MKNKHIIMFLIIVMSITLAACNSDKGNSSEAEAAGTEPLKIRIAGQSPDDHPSTQAMYDFAEQVEEKTDGRIKIKVYPANQLGDYTTVYEEIGRGTIEMGLISIPSELDNRLELLFTPYMVESYDGIVEAYERGSFVFNKIEEISNEKNVQLLAFHANGFGGIGTTKEVGNILNFEEDKNLLLRVPPIDAFKQPIEDIGFRTVTIPFADLYTSLQTGAAEGWTGGEASLNYYGYRDAIKYFYATNDFFNPDSLLINKDLFEKISEEDRKVMEEFATELMNKSFETAESNDEKYRDLMRDEGIEVVEFSKEEISDLAKFVRKTTWPKLKKRVGEDIIDELTNQFDK